MPPRLGLKIDVDTLEGLRQGVPALQEILDARGISASFFVALGPDNSGRAIFRVFRQQGFLEKMVRTRAPSVYGLRTMLYGTLLPAPIIGEVAPEILPSLVAGGHEVGLHGYDHVRWHDQLLSMTPEDIAQEVAQGQAALRAALGCEASAFAAPGWQASRTSRAVLAAAGILYASDTRGTKAYYPRFGAEVTRLLEIPTTLPTLDELLGFHGCTPDDFTALILSRLGNGAPQVLTIHAELEGGPFQEIFARLLDLCQVRGVTFFRLEDYARELLQSPQDIPIVSVFQGRLPGRAGTVSCQGVLESRT